MRCCRKLMGISYIERTMNDEVLRQVPGRSRQETNGTGEIIT